MSKEKRVVAHPHTFPFQVCKIQLHRGDATGTTTQTDRSKQVWINQNLSKNWAKPSSTTQHGEVVVIYTGITKKGESSNLTLSKGIIRKALPSAALGRKGQEKHSQISVQKIHLSCKPFPCPWVQRHCKLLHRQPALEPHWSRVGDMTSVTGQSFKQGSNNHLTNTKRQPQMLAQQRSISKSQMEMNRNMLSYPQPSVPLRSLFYKLTYCSKSQIFRNSSGWRYYQEKRSASANQCNWVILSRSWGSDDRNWKSKIAERGKHWPLRYIGKEQQEQHLTVQVMFSSAKSRWEA